MEQYIPKSDVVAEIERRAAFFLEESKKKTTSDDSSCSIALYGLLSFVNTLEVIEVDLGKEIDLDAAIDAYMDKNFGEPWDGARPVGSFELATMAEYFFKLGLKAQKGE